MLSRFNKAIEETKDYIEQYRFNDAATTLYRYLWGEFCDWGIELSKASKESVSELGSIFKESMKLLHPLMPFITEYLYQKLSATELNSENSIMVQEYPTVQEVDTKIVDTFELAIEAIVSIRRCKTLVDMGNKKIEKAYVKFTKEVDNDLLKPFLEKLAKVEEIEFVTTKPESAVTDVSDNLESYISTADIDMSPIIKKLENQKAKLEKEIAKLNGMLNNEKFVANAPEAVITQNRQALADLQEKLEKVNAELASLS